MLHNFYAYIQILNKQSQTVDKGGSPLTWRLDRGLISLHKKSECYEWPQTWEWWLALVKMTMNLHVPYFTSWAYHRLPNDFAPRVIYFVPQLLLFHFSVNIKMKMLSHTIFDHSVKTFLKSWHSRTEWVKKLPVFYETKRFITVFTRTITFGHLNPSHNQTPYFFKIHFHTIFPPSLDLPSGHFFSHFQSSILYALLMLPSHTLSSPQNPPWFDCSNNWLSVNYVVHVFFSVLYIPSLSSNHTVQTVFTGKHLLVSLSM